MFTASTLDRLQHVKTLIIDNYDSYTFNLLQLFGNVANVAVIRNDQFTWDEFKDRILPQFDNIVISPGPGRPERGSDFGICSDLLSAQLDLSQKQYHRPIFGVCLGHQGLAHVLGGKVIYAPRIMHGRISQINVCADNSPMFSNCSTPFWAVRYHSLVVDKNSLPDSLMLTAYCYENDADVEALKESKYLADDGKENGEAHYHFLHHPQTQPNDLITIMGFQHKELPLWGVQFHPESVSSEFGAQMIHNFMLETLRWCEKQHREIDDASLDHSFSVARQHTTCPPPSASYRLISRTIYTWVEPEDLVQQLKITGALPVRTVSWLDSNRKSSPYSKMSVLSVDPAYSITYSTLHRQVNRNNRSGNKSITTLEPGETFFDFLSRKIKQCQLQNDGSNEKFQGGFIGYFGYEMKRESMDGYVTPKEQLCKCKHNSIGDVPCCKCASEPDAGFHFIDRFWIFDTMLREIRACCLVSTRDNSADDLVGFNTEAAAEEWLDKAERAVSDSVVRFKGTDEFATLTPTSSTSSICIPDSRIFDLFRAEEQRERYLKAIEKCIHEIREGESYELCLTTRFFSPLLDKDINLWHLYTQYLRRNNPAPYSAFLEFSSLTLLSSSPERFISVSADGQAEMKPIKGTTARALDCVCENGCDEKCSERVTAEDERRKQTLWQDVKERAENLMIVDLIRNDLAQVCDPSSVSVPKLMHVETYEKLHHLVSTVRAKLQPAVSSVDAVRKCFPPGSMTGAPKLRSVQILDDLEQHKPRGVYSGCLGYFSLDGSADFSVVIRTAVASRNANGLGISVGAGGAITFLSDPEQEWRETLLKTRSVAPSVIEYISHF